MFDPQAVARLIRYRRSVKPELMSDEEIPDALVEEMLELARWAPNHGLTQPWRFHVFSGAGRDRLGRFLAETYRETHPGEAFKEVRFQKLRKRPGHASHVLSIGLYRTEESRFPEWEDLAAVACAVQNVQLAATAHGVCSYWSSGKPTEWAATAPFIGLPPTGRCLGFLYLGYPDGDWPVSKRNPVDSYSRWVRE